jgi:hypothetical protein
MQLVQWMEAIYTAAPLHLSVMVHGIGKDLYHRILLHAVRGTSGSAIFLQGGKDQQLMQHCIMTPVQQTSEFLWENIISQMVVSVYVTIFWYPIVVFDIILLSGEEQLFGMFYFSFGKYRSDFYCLTDQVIEKNFLIYGMPLHEMLLNASLVLSRRDLLF